MTAIDQTIIEIIRSFMSRPDNFRPAEQIPVGKEDKVLITINREDAEKTVHHVLCDSDGLLNREGIVFRDRLLDCLGALGLITIVGDKWNASNWAGEG